MRYEWKMSFKIILGLLILLMMPAHPAFAGRLLATGHDADLHCADQDEQCHFFEVAVDYVRGGAMKPSLPVLILDRLDLDAERALDKAFPPAGSVPRDVVDPRSTAFQNLAIDPMIYSAVIIASDFTCFGCDLNEADSTPDSDAINARAADFAAFFNGGGGILALAGAENRGVYYDFLPLPVGAAAVSMPFTLTPAGIALGFEDSQNGIGTRDDVNCCQTHNSFALPAPGSPIQVAELDSQGLAETIFVEGSIINGEIVPPCLKPIFQKALCTTDGTGDYTLDLSFQNLSGDTIEHLFIVEPSGFTPNYFHFSPAIRPNGARPLKGIRIHGASPGPFTFQTTLHNADFEQCCIGEITVELPPCDCAQITSLKGPNCFFSPPPPYNYTFTLNNLTSMPIDNLLLAPKPPANVTLMPNFLTNLNLAPVPYTGGAGSVTQTVTIGGPDAQPGEKICFDLSLHDRLFQECCSIEQCVTLPQCTIVTPWWVVGGATIAVLPDRVVISGIGTSGDDGAKVEVGEAASFRLGWLDLDPAGDLPPGSRLRMSATGAILGEPRELGSIELTKAASSLQLAADFTPVDSPTQRLEVYQAGELVGTVTGHSGAVALRTSGNTVVIWPRALGKIGGGSGTTCYVGEWEEPIRFEIPGVGTFEGDELRVLAENQEAPLDFIDSLTLQAASIPEITIVEAEGTYDCNHNGVGDDLDIANGTSVDSDADGVPDECRTPPANLEIRLNTGFDEAAGALLPRGAADPDWTVVNADPPAAAKVVVQPVAVWATPLADSAWISVEPQRGSSVPGLDRPRFERCFCLGAATGEVELDLELYADDEATVLLNGETIAGPGGGFTPASRFEVEYSETLGSGLLRVGENCLTVEVNDRGGVVTGLDLAGTIRAARGACP